LISLIEAGHYKDLSLVTTAIIAEHVNWSVVVMQERGQHPTVGLLSLS